MRVCAQYMFGLLSIAIILEYSSLFSSGSPCGCQPSEFLIGAAMVRNSPRYEEYPRLRFEELFVKLSIAHRHRTTFIGNKQE